MSFEDQRLKEALEILDGSRGRRSRRAAIRIEDVEAVLQLPAKLKSAKAAGAAPTAEEFDALVEDVQRLYNVLMALATAVQKRVLP